MAISQPGVWGIDLGQCALKAIRLDTVDGEVTATAFDYVEHPKILSQPDADPDELTREALQQFLSRNSIKGDMVVISVPGQSGLARFVKLPPVEEKKIADIVRFEAKQQIPFPLEEVVWDFQKIGQGAVSDGFAMETEIGLFAMKKDMVHRALQQFKDVNVEIHVIQMAPLALCNYVAYDLLHKDGMGGGADGEAADKKECVVALDIGTDNSNLIITDGEKIIWQRPIPLGGNHFTRALTKDMKLTFAKAEHLKRNAVKSPELKKILASLKTVLNDFVGEVQRSLGYFTNTHRDATIQYMIGLGNAFRLPGLQKYLQEKLQLEVRKLTKLERVTGEEVVAAPTFTENLMSFAVAYGLALQGMKLSRIQTNLLPYEIRVERIVRGKKPWAVAAAAALLLAVAGLTFGYSVEKKGVANPNIKSELDRAKDTLKKIRQLQGEYDIEVKRKTDAEKIIRRMGAGVDERFNWQRLMQYINMALPRPNGDRLAVQSLRNEFVRKRYLTPDSQKAFEMLEIKRFAKGEPLSAEQEEYIKRYLIQINIEGINALYTEDLPIYLKNVYEDNPLLPGMPLDEHAIVKSIAKKDPSYMTNLTHVQNTFKRNWIVEIRGYTYNVGAANFVENTFLENLLRPTAEGLAEKMTKEMKETAELVRKQIHFMELYRNDPKQQPVPGVFEFISKSKLKTLIKDPNAAQAFVNLDANADPNAPPVKEGPKLNRDDWVPLGEVGSTVFAEVGRFNVLRDPNANAPGAAPTVQRQARIEFVLLFVWNEPLGEAPPPPPPPPTADAAEAAK